jgi:hypothetical protein
MSRCLIKITAEQVMVTKKLTSHKLILGEGYLLIRNCNFGQKSCGKINIFYKLKLIHYNHALKWRKVNNVKIIYNAPEPKLSF